MARMLLHVEQSHIMTHVTQFVACLSVLVSTNHVIALHYSVQQFPLHAVHFTAER